LELETHREVFPWVLRVLAQKGLLRGKTIGLDATTLAAKAALRSIVRRDTGPRYEKYLTDLAKASGLATPRRQDWAPRDRKRPTKGSNAERYPPHDPEAKIAKMKDGRTQLAPKAEQAVDLDPGARVAVTRQEANQGDTTTVYATVAETADNLTQVRADPETTAHVAEKMLQEVVTDKGYPRKETVNAWAERDIRR